MLPDFFLKTANHTKIPLSTTIVSRLEKVSRHPDGIKNTSESEYPHRQFKLPDSLSKQLKKLFKHPDIQDSHAILRHADNADNCENIASSIAECV